MADITITGLPNELLSGAVDGDADFQEIDSTGAAETMKVRPRALLIGLTGQTVGAAGKAITAKGGTGAAGDVGTVGGNGGDGVLDAGPGGASGGAGAGTNGAVLIGTTDAASVASGSGTTVWTHSGDLTVVGGAFIGTLEAPAGLVGAPSVAVGAALTDGLYQPVANQLGLAANGEAMIVDNTAADPSLRGDVHNTWTSGTDTVRMKTGFFGSGSAASPAVAVGPVGTSHGLHEDAGSLRLGVAGVAEVQITAGRLSGISTGALKLGSSSFRMGTSYINRLILQANTAASPAVTVGTAAGLHQPATNQLGLAANSESVIVDNDGATPSLRPDADNVWACGEASFRWTTVHSVALNTGDVILRGQRDDAHWVMNESRRGIYFHDLKSGKVYKVPLVEVDPSEAPAPLEER